MEKKRTRNILATGAGALVVGLALIVKKGLPFLIGYGIVTGLSGRYSEAELAAFRSGVEDVGARWPAVEELWADSSDMATKGMAARVLALHLEDAEYRQLLETRVGLYRTLTDRPDLWAICEGGATADGDLDGAEELIDEDIVMRFLGRASGRQTLGRPRAVVREPSQAEYDALAVALDESGYSSTLDRIIAGEVITGRDACTFTANIYEFVSGPGVELLGLKQSVGFARWLEISALSGT